MQSTGFSTVDYIVFIGYALIIVFIGLFVSRTKKGTERTAKDYFLANRALPWWVIGATLICSNISAEQFIGMSGSGYKIGLGIASYEWMAALTLIIVGKYFLPIFLKEEIYTMPQFLERRFDNRVRTSLAVFWLLVYVFVNLTSILYLGALSIKTILGFPLLYGILFLALFSALYSIYGGLKAVAWTDVVQVVFLVFGGLLATYMGVSAVSGGHGFIAGFRTMLEHAPEKFHMILSKDNPNYINLPGISVLVGGMWIMNLSYWGFNQYITQRAFAGKTLAEAQRGVVFAGYLKLLMPLIVVIPGIAAFCLHANISKPDEAYPWLLHNFIPPGIKGLVFAALVAAIVSSLSSMINSISTIFTMDIYRQLVKTEPSEHKKVMVGRITAGLAILVAILVAPNLSNLDQAFQFIQEFTGFVTPGVLVIFLAGFFYKRTTPNAALWVAILTIPLALGMKKLFPAFPFMDRMGVIFIILSAVAVVVSLLESKTNHPKAITIEKGLFHTDVRFNIGAIGICAILAVLYVVFW
ncbi:MAG: sodium/sugar symporter [Bacteroidia bacterium]|nr:sodium/sugar symporter [Bacteroidia bacterium]